MTSFKKHFNSYFFSFNKITNGTKELNIIDDKNSKDVSPFIKKIGINNKKIKFLYLKKVIPTREIKIGKNHKNVKKYKLNENIFMNGEQKKKIKQVIEYISLKFINKRQHINAKTIDEINPIKNCRTKTSVEKENLKFLKIGLNDL